MPTRLWSAPRARSLVRSCSALVFLSGTYAWLIALLVAPYLAMSCGSSRPRLITSTSIYVLGGLVCHQRSERSFHLSGAQLPVCARCTGIYGAAPFGATVALLPWVRRRMYSVAVERCRTFISVAAVPTAVTLLLEGSHLVEPSAVFRVMAGGILGASIAATMSSALVGSGRRILEGRPGVKASSEP